MVILCFLAGSLSLCQTGTTTSLPLYSFLFSSFTTVSASSGCCPSLACCFPGSVVTCCLCSACSSSKLLLQSSTLGAQHLATCLLASNRALHVEVTSSLCFILLQICLFFFSSFITLSEHLLSHPKSQLRIYHQQHFPPLASSPFSLPDLDITHTSSENCCKDRLSEACSMFWGSGLPISQWWQFASASPAGSSVPL